MQQIDPLKMIDTILNYGQILPSALDDAEKRIKYLDGECNDIEHHMEFNNLSKEELLKHAERLRDAKIERRECKDLMELGIPLRELFKKSHNFFDSLRRVRGMVVATTRDHENRRYYVRSREDLRPYFEADLYKSIEYDTGESEHSDSEDDIETNVAKWKCENPECNEEFITGEVDEPRCPACGHDKTKEIGEVEVTDKR